MMSLALYLRVLQVGLNEGYTFYGQCIGYRPVIKAESRYRTMFQGQPPLRLYYTVYKYTRNVLI